MKIQVCLITAVLTTLFITACDGDQVSGTQEETQVAIVTVNQDHQYVELQNNQNTVQNLSGWYLSLGRSLICQLEDEIHIQPGETLRIRTLAQDAGEGGYNCGLDRPFWSGKEPKRIFLYNADHQLIDSYFDGES